jgi:hypothetical protein
MDKCGVEMIEYLKKYNKKTIDIYDLAFLYTNKAFLLWSKEEINNFLRELQELEAQKIIELKRNSKGEGKLDLIQRKININKWKLLDESDGIDDSIFNNALGIDGSYYLKNNKEYLKDKCYIERLADFLLKNNGELTLNEIGYLVFMDEKALTQPDKAVVNGKRILGNLKIDLNNISYTETISPFYYPTNSNGDTVLIVENKDTCFSLFRLFTGVECNIKGILYGEGRAIVKIFNFLKVYGLDNKSEYLYYGDIDQEGFDIFRALRDKYPGYNIKLSKVLYHNLLKYETHALKNKRKLDNSGIEMVINDLWDEDKEKIISVLKNDEYIPQEALNFQQMRVIISGLQNRLF